MTKRLPAAIRRALDATGKPWAIELGNRHRKIILANRFVGILPLGRSIEADRATKNVVAQIRRASRS
jgi:hypothetical protein